MPFGVDLKTGCMKRPVCLLTLFSFHVWALSPISSSPLDPRGEAHIPIGIPDTVDTLKTFVEAEGNFSPGVGSYGIYFWVWGATAGRLFAPTMDEVECEHGLADGGLLIPWSKWRAGDVEVKTEVCHVLLPSPEGACHVVGARITLKNSGDTPAETALFVALRPVGAAGSPVTQIGVSSRLDALIVEGRSAIVAEEPAAAGGVSVNDDTAALALGGRLPSRDVAESATGDCSGALSYELVLEPGRATTLGFICPVLAGRRAVGHRWDGVSAWAQFDLNRPNPEEAGLLQPDPGVEFFRKLKTASLFVRAAEYWREFCGKVRLRLPDSRWSESFAAILGHSALCMNQGAPDVAVVNYNVFNRDGMYMANIFQKSGNPDLAEKAIDYFLAHPFNGRVRPEADNPGQILWVMGEHWKFTRNRAWLRRVYPAVRRLAAMVRYYRTTPGPHWVWDTSLDFGSALPSDKRKELKPGACDGHHPEYTEAYDIAGLRAAVELAEASGVREDAESWRRLADELFDKYDARFGAHLPKGYGSYSVLWPCRLYPFDESKASEQFKSVGAQRPTSWRYFPLARAHQGLLAGRREAGWKTLEIHLDHEQMHGWYAFDEGGRSGTGGWNHLLTRWRQGKNSVAMPHGWAIAEFQLLLRDCLVVEDGDRLVLLSGIPPSWFQHPDGMRIEGLATHYGRCSFFFSGTQGGATLELTGSARPPGGFVLRLPRSLRASVHVDGTRIPPAGEADFLLPRNTKKAECLFARQRDARP